MDFLTFLSNIINSVALPGSILVALWIFRIPLTELLNAITNAKFRYSKGETTIEAELNALREKTPSIQEIDPPEEILNLVKTSPTKAINRSWKDLEASATAAASVSTPSSPIKIADMLLDKNILSQNEAEAFYKMHEIQEATTHSDSKFITDVSSASLYSGIAYGLTQKISGTGQLKAGPASIDSSGVVEHKD